ncbi:MAG: site-specific DNA-methyltransferase [Thermoanaerobacterales bacterium]|nr:site-specific DNA-methyltransferase [Thermoanaerobacterales bacterium]
MREKKLNFTGPLSVEFLKQNKNLVLDTKHFTTEFKERLIASIDNLDEETDGLLIHSENFQALNLLQERYREKIKCVHIDPPYNTDTSGFLYKNNYRHSSWLSMMYDRISEVIKLLSDQSCIQIHIDENEYEKLFIQMQNFNLINQGTIIWDKRNPVSGTSRIATQHEYICCFSKNSIKLMSKKTNGLKILKKQTN